MGKTDFPDHVLEKDPSIHPSAFVAGGAHVLGDVCLAEEASIWYNCVVRGDINAIVIGKRSNIQDGSILHVENDRSCIVGDDVTVGHHVNLHACKIEEGCLIGIGAIVLSGALVKKGSVVGAGAVVKEGMVVEPRSLVVGVPAKKIKEIDEDVVQTNMRWAQKYVQLARLHKKKYGPEKT